MIQVYIRRLLVFVSNFDVLACVKCNERNVMELKQTISRFISRGFIFLLAATLCCNLMLLICSKEICHLAVGLYNLLRVQRVNHKIMVLWCSYKRCRSIIHIYVYDVLFTFTVVFSQPNLCQYLHHFSVIRRLLKRSWLPIFRALFLFFFLKVSVAPNRLLSMLMILKVFGMNRCLANQRFSV